MKYKVNFNSKPEKTIIAATVSIALAIFFGGSEKKKLKHPEKYKNYPKRVIANYKKLNSIFDKLAVKAFSKQAEEEYKSKSLQNFTIENGEFIDL